MVVKDVVTVVAVAVAVVVINDGGGGGGDGCDGGGSGGSSVGESLGWWASGQGETPRGEFFSEKDMDGG